MKITNKKLTDLIPYDNNPRDNAEAVQYVAASIREFGFRIPLVVTPDNVIVAGHTRYLAAQELGMKEVPCVIADDLTDEQVKAYRLADNKTAEMSGWDMEKLEQELSEISLGMDAFGFDLRREAEEEMAQEDDQTPEMERVVCPRCGKVFEVEVTA